MAHLSDETYTAHEVACMEVRVLNVISWEVSPATAMHFVALHTRASQCDDRQRLFVQFLLELSLGDHRFMAFPPSLLSAAAVYLSNFLFGSTPWTPALTSLSGYA